MGSEKKRRKGKDEILQISSRFVTARELSGLSEKKKEERVDPGLRGGGLHAEIMGRTKIQRARKGRLSSYQRELWREKRGRNTPTKKGSCTEKRLLRREGGEPKRGLQSGNSA